MITKEIITNFIDLNKNSEELPFAFIDDYLFDKTKSNEEKIIKYLNLPIEMAQKNINEYFPQLNVNIKNFEDLK